MPRPFLTRRPVFTNILVAVDESEPARWATEFAVRLAKELRAKVSLVHVVGAIGVLALLHYNMSVAVWVGIIALAGLDAETGVVMLLYLDLAYTQWIKDGRMRNLADLRDAIYHGAVKRVRPKAMTACVIIAGLAPILWSHGTGADVMKRIATPMIGGVIASTLMELLVYPPIFFLWRSRQLKGMHKVQTPPGDDGFVEPVAHAVS